MASLFPDWPPAQKLVGIANLAAQGPLLEAKRRVEYFQLPTRTYITRCASDRVPFAFTINPYRGCEFGCKYCYARYTHEFMELRKPEDFEVRIFAKLWNPSAFTAELAKVPRREHIAIGTATDPYQPAERRFGITRKILEILARDHGRRIWITTKSDLVARDTELLAGIARRNLVSVNMTVTTLDEKLARQIEPYAPRPSLRLGAIRALARSGIPCGVLCCPIMPLINDSAAGIDEVARAAAEAGAASFSGNVLFLKPCASRVFLPFLESEFPHLVRRYRERFGNTAFLRGEYPELIHRRVVAARERHGLGGRPVDYDPRELSDDLQLPLFPSGS